MKIIDDFSTLPHLRFPVVTSGTFDGVHFGHQKILRNVVRQAQNSHGESIVITYWPHPRFVLGKNSKELRLLTTFEEKAQYISDCGIDYLIKVPFTRSFSQLTADEYIDAILVNGVKARKLILGYDHKFGKNQEGSFHYLVEHKDAYGFEIEEIPRQDIEHVGVSSTKIRSALNSGDIHTANEYLGRPYRVKGLVTKGEQIGRKMGFPTANIYVPEEYKLIPSDGVYAVMAHLGDQSIKGMLNIGKRPTVSGLNKTIEVNLFNFDEDIYGRTLSIDFIDFLRNEQKFENLEQLKKQLNEDKDRAINRLKSFGL